MPEPVELASETTKQILTLSTAIITIGFAFVKDIAPEYSAQRGLLTASVIAHLVSCAFGIWTMMAITGLSHNPSGNPSGIYSFSVKLPSFLQIISFLIGLGSMCFLILGVGSGDGT